MGVPADEARQRGGALTEWPPLGFSPYGLDETWPGSRRLEMFDGPAGVPSPSVWFGHREVDQPGYLLVGTGPRSRFARNADAHPDRQEREAAWSAAYWLLNLSLPHFAVPRPPGWSRKLTDHIHEQADRHATWPVALWYVDGETADARIWRFAHGWAGYTAAHDDHLLMLVGIDIDVEGWHLVAFDDTRPYGFDLDQPLRAGLLNEILAERGGPEHAIPAPRADWHPNHVAVLRN